MDIIGNIKNVAKTIQQIDNIELYSKILNVQQEAMDLVDENRKLKDDVRELKDSLKVKEELIFERSCYWIKGEKKDGPFCTRCWDVDKNLVRMHPSHNPAFYSCPDKSCGASSVEVFPEKNPNITMRNYNEDNH